MNASRITIDDAYRVTCEAIGREHGEALRNVDRRAPDASARLDAIRAEFAERYTEAARAYRAECDDERWRARAWRAWRA